MNIVDQVRNEYFEWLSDIVCERKFSKQISFKKLLMCLHNIKFTYTIPRDKNRAGDGRALRYRFYLRHGRNEEYKCITGPCSVLEMMVALAVDCEENIMSDPDIGDRTGQWFWEMIVSLGLGGMSDDRFDRELVEETIDRFLHHEYAPNGKGGLFTVDNCDKDLRKLEIWHQLCCYLNSIT